MTAEKAHRLGKNELGSYAFEESMPPKLAALIQHETSANKLHGVIPQLAHLLRQARNVDVAYLCHDSTVQICKSDQEGNHFCGYRNLQMMLPLVRTIPDLQKLIEAAWDAGFNTHSRTETGGIIGTRKHIGTSEVEACLLYLGISCTGFRFTGPTAWTQLLDIVEKYFASRSTASHDEKVVHTGLHPIFLQRPQHSLTIVGIERSIYGSRKLLVFDPAHHPPTSLRHPSTLKSRLQPDYLTLARYRIGEFYLRHYQQFEIVHIDEISSPNQISAYNTK